MLTSRLSRLYISICSQVEYIWTTVHIKLLYISIPVCLQVDCTYQYAHKSNIFGFAALSHHWFHFVSLSSFSLGLLELHIICSQVEYILFLVSAPFHTALYIFCLALLSFSLAYLELHIICFWLRLPFTPLLHSFCLALLLFTTRSPRRKRQLTTLADDRSKACWCVLHVFRG